MFRCIIYHLNATTFNTINNTIFIPKESKHRMTNNTDEIVEFIEIQIGDYLGEDDIVRLEDDFGRV